MNAIDRLKRDHKILRSKLDLLEAALTMKADTWFVLREVCFSLSRQLRDHMRREELLVSICKEQVDPKVLKHVSVEHQDEPQLLRTINKLFVSEKSHSLEHIKPALTEVISGLRHHMEEEEKMMFPAIERLLQPSALDLPRRSLATDRLDETMTVNCLVKEYPKTRPVLEHLFVNVPVEGCNCLDEVAWRHGMDSQELLRTLEETIQSCGCVKEEPVSAQHAREV